jgi:hypothetical protein
MVKGNQPAPAFCRPKTQRVKNFVLLATIRVELMFCIASDDPRLKPN